MLLRDAVKQQAPHLDEEVLNYLDAMLEDLVAQGTVVDLASLQSELSAFLVQFEVVADEEGANQLLGQVDIPLQEKSVSKESKKKRSVARVSSQVDSDAWGTKTMPVKNIVNQVVENVESPAERRRRERKAEKEKRLEEMAKKRQEEQANQDKSARDSSQVVASGAVAGARSSGRDIHVDNISISVGAVGGAVKDLLLSASLRLTRGARYGFIARNGYGKSTLLQKIAHREIDKFPSDVSILYVAQEVPGSNDTAIDFVLKGDAELMQLQLLEKQAAEASDTKLMLEVSRKLEAIDAAGAEGRARALLSGLGFSDSMQEKPTMNLSGGWRMRAALASALFASPDLLLLDEPTNGLSLDAVVWLENYIQSNLAKSTTLVVVSHDRVFLNNVVDNVIQIENQALHYYKGDVDTFEKTKAQLNAQKRREREAQLGKIAHMQKFVDKFRYNAKRASLAQSRIKAISRMERVLCDEVFSEPEMKLEFPDPGDDVAGPLIMCESITFSYDANSKPLFSNVDFTLSPGDKVVLLGLNGLGKSTFLKLISGELEPTHGCVRRKPTCRMSMFAQHSVEQLDSNSTPLEFLLERFPGTKDFEVRAHLSNFGVTADLSIQKISTLSGGQKARVAFALVTFRNPHILLMDEPSAHLDIETADALNAASLAWSGALLTISHDQNLISTVADELWVLENHSIQKLKGDFAGYKKRLLKQGCGSA